MSREELLESAALDAYGLLDDYEASLYTRSFHHAPASVQNEILQLQAELVSDDTSMPSENPDPGLRQRVLDAVAEAIEIEAPQLEPLAIIGRPRAVAEAPTPAQYTYSRFWRAASLGLCAGLIVALYLLTQSVRSGNDLAKLALSNNTDSQLEQMIGPTFKDYVFDPTAAPVRFTPTVQGTNMRAVIYMVENSENAFLVFEGLQHTEYTLRVRDAEGGHTQIQTFNSTGRLSGVKVALNHIASELKGASLEIVSESGVALVAKL